MDTPQSVDLGHVSQELNVPLELIERTVELLDEGNTIPFISRFRREKTGGLDEQQIRAIHSLVGKQRQILERKRKILRTVEAKGKLTPELTEEVRKARTLKRLDDLYFPFKPKKQTLATQAKEKGLDPLADEILSGNLAADQLESRAAVHVSPENGLPSVADVLASVGHLVAERFSERADLRGKLRRIFSKTGRIVCSRIETPEPEQARTEELAPEASDAPPSDASPQGSLSPEADAEVNEAGVEQTMSLPAEELAPTNEAGQVGVTSPASPHAGTHTSESQTESVEVEQDLIHTTTPTENNSPNGETNLSHGETHSEPGAEAVSSGPSTEALGVAPPELRAKRLFEKPSKRVIAPDFNKKLKKKKRKATEAAFKDYFNYSEALSQAPAHRVLAINRGERARVIRVRIEADEALMEKEAYEVLGLAKHPLVEFLKPILHDALIRLIIPSLEREARRELGEAAETHAVEVFARNLRTLLLQPPVHARRVLAVDPGYKTGCKIVALDEYGTLLDHNTVYIIGKDERRKAAQVKIAEMVRQHGVSVIAIGNGAGSRETEQVIADTIANELQDWDVAYVMVNEAGASIYSTSQLGREELPTLDPMIRSAVSIGRRLLDPLSELVKINPQNIGVGLYQHDLSAKHMKESLDAVVESSVNYVGVDLNAASPALLRYVSGLNALTARRIYEYRREHGPFRNRSELMKVQGFGEATFIQAAGFLKIRGAENPLDATGVHPESYELATRLLEKLDTSLEEMRNAFPTSAPAPQTTRRAFGGLETLPTPEGVTTAPDTESANTSEASTLAPLEIAETGSNDSPKDTPAADEPLGQSENETTSLPTPASPTLAETGEGETGQGAKSIGQNASPELNESRSEEVDPKFLDAIIEKANSLRIEQVAKELNASPILIDDLLIVLTRPLRDPREQFPAPMMRRGITRLEDLQPGMELTGAVLNVVDFGAFVDIGLADSGLVHISRLADHFIRDPHEVVGVGDVLRVWVVEVDRNRRRVSLTAIPPGAEPSHSRQRPPRRRNDRGEASVGPPQAGSGNRAQSQAPPSEGRRPRPRRPVQGNQQGVATPQGQGQPQNQGHANQGPPPQGQPRHGGQRRQGGRRDQNQGGGPPPPRVVERPPTKPKVSKPISKAMLDGREPLRSFGDLIQYMDKNKKKKPDAPPEGTK